MNSYWINMSMTAVQMQPQADAVLPLLMRRTDMYPSTPSGTES
jgi:hypothetical protein